MKFIFLFLSLLVVGVPSLRADDPGAPAAPDAAVDPAKEAEIRKMIQTTGVERTMKVVMNHMMDSFKTQNSGLPPDFWTRIESELDTKELMEQLIPIYAQYYSLDDLKAVNAFYESPAGQHMVQVQPQIATAAMQVGQQWGRGVATKVMAEIQAEQAKTPAPATPPPTSGK